MRRDLLNRVSNVLQRYKPGKLHCFGSFAAGLYLPNSDMDLVFVSRQFEERGVVTYGNKRVLYDCLQRLTEAGIVRRGSGAAVAKAKVPIIKFVDDLTGLRVDISFENLTGVVANDTYQQWKREHRAMIYLVPVIKQFLMMRDLNEVFSGGLGGFSITCLVVSFLQQHPAIQSGSMVQEQHLGELLVEFLDLYGNRFNMEMTGITLNPPGYFPKVVCMSQHKAPLTIQVGSRVGPKVLKQGRWTIIDPNNRTNDISGGTSSATHIASKFGAGCRALKERMQLLERQDVTARKGQSILGRLVGGNYAVFAEQRAQLHNVFVRMAATEGARE